MKKATLEVVKYDKIQEITLESSENLAAFMSRLTDAVLKYTNLDPKSEAGSLFLHAHFISQSVPGIRRKCKKLEDSPQTSQQDLIKAAFWVFNNRE